MAVTVPRCGPEFVNWALSDEYHNVPGGHVRIYRYRELVARLERTGLTVMGSHHAHGLHAPYWWLRCLVGPTNDDHPAVAAYHRLLVWDIAEHLGAHPLQRAPGVLNPVLGKSLVVYLLKPARVAPVAAATPSSAGAGERLAGRSGGVDVRVIPEVPGILTPSQVLATPAHSIAWTTAS